MNSQEADPAHFAENWLESLGKTFNLDKHQLPDICNELRKKGGPFKKLDPYFDLKNGQVVNKAFLINHCNERGIEMDLMIVSLMKSCSLFTLQDFTLDITNYLLGKSAVFRPSGNSCFGWQSLISNLGRLIQLQDFQAQAWARATIKKINRYRCLEPFPNALYENMRAKSLSSILKGVLENHLKKNPAASCMYLLEAASDLLNRGFHPLDVDKISQMITLEGQLPPDFKIMKEIKQHFPIDFLLAFFRLKKTDRSIVQSETEDGFVHWLHDRYECTIYLKKSKAIEILILYELQLRAGQFHEHVFSETMLQLEALPCKEKSGPKEFLVLQAVQTHDPEFMIFACDLYFKNCKNPLAVDRFLAFLSTVHRKKARQLFVLHLKQVEGHTDLHAALFENLADFSTDELQLTEKIETIHCIIAMGQAILKRSPQFQDKINQVIQTRINHLKNHQPKLGCYLLRHSAESHLISKDCRLWLECCESLLGTKNGLEDAAKLWALADHLGIWENFRCPEDLKDFVIHFVEALFQEGSDPKIRIGGALLKWIEFDQYADRHTQRVEKLQKLQALKEAEFEASQGDLKKKIEYLKKALSQPALMDKSKIRGVFLEILEIVSGMPYNKMIWNDNFNMLLKLMNLPQIEEFLLDGPCKSELIKIIESAYHSNFFTEAFSQMFNKILLLKPFDHKIVPLIIRVVREQRFECSGTFCKNTWRDVQGDCIREFSAHAKDEDLLYFIRFLDHQNLSLCVTEETLTIFLTSLQRVLQVQHKGLSSASEHLHDCALMRSKCCEELITGLGPSLMLQQIIEALLSYPWAGEEAVHWIHLYLKRLNWTEKGLSAADAEKLIQWTENLTAQGIHKGTLSLIRLLGENKPDLEDKLFKLLMEMPEECFTYDLQLPANLSIKAIKKNPEILESWHITKGSRI